MSNIADSWGKDVNFHVLTEPLSLADAKNLCSMKAILPVVAWGNLPAKVRKPPIFRRYLLHFLTLIFVSAKKNQSAPVLQMNLKWRTVEVWANPQQFHMGPIIGKVGA
ncbi:hypothetical protein RHMOL_Rhmol03G0083200 [Rhododendron molle]|uniref:Uncharacterized protein n=1 Tax=Rhododendron molle TaxID=49168 RepID=A0ACC0PC12_RHOML|nr:hypothetical protein RHMOL_Rhmol03G0083200 [Rhododendron molle]